MQRILFLRDFRPPSKGRLRTHGGHIKLRDYFLHCLEHPALDPYVYFTPRSDHTIGDVWAGAPASQVVHEIEPGRYDLFFVTDKDWKLLPQDRGDARLIHYVQSLEHCDPSHRIFRYLRRAALRICVSEAVEAASAPHRRGEAVVIENGIPLDLFTPAADKRAGSVLIWGRKQPSVATAIRDALAARDVDVTLLLEYGTRQEFASQLAAAGVFVGLPKATEGFFLPALEAMASGCAVVCADAIGNRSFCIDGTTCLLAAPDDANSYIAQIERLLAESELRARIRRGGLERARAHSLEHEREQFYQFLERFVLVPA